MESAETSMYDPEATYVGLDVHKDTISVGVLEPGNHSAVVDKIFHDEESVRRLVGRLSGIIGCGCATRRVRPGTNSSGF